MKDPSPGLSLSAERGVRTRYPLSSHPMATSTEAWNDDLLRDPHRQTDKRARVQKMFAAIAPSYDLNNRLHSMGIDQLWRKRAVKLAELRTNDVVVDVACGTGDLSLEFLKYFERTDWMGVNNDYAEQIVGVDFTFEMLPIARNKSRTNQRSPIAFINGDAQALPLPDQCCDLVSIAFGIRNVQDPALALREFYRVLRPGGRVIVLEFSLPTNSILRGLYNFYFRQILPRTATLISGDKTGAYKYLPESVNTFISRDTMIGLMTAAGFEKVEQFSMTFGVCICYRGYKPNAQR